MPTFQLNSKLTSGTYAGDYNWNTALNWDNSSIPGDGAGITLPDGTYTSVDDIPSIQGINLTLGNDVTMIVGLGDTAVENINGFGTNSTFQTDGTADIVTALAGNYVVNGAAASLEIDGINGTASFHVIGGNATFTSNANLNSNTSFDFTGVDAGTVTIEGQNNYLNGWAFPVTNFGSLDTIVLGTSVFEAGFYPDAYNSVAHTLTIPKAGNNGNFVFDNFSVATGEPTSFLVTATSVQDNVNVCFVKGTRIRTDCGDVTVETLRVGDMVVTLSGDYKSIRWIGQRRIDLTRHPEPEAASPIRIRRGALSDEVPARDLLVSPNHAIYLDGVLICARQLVNGTTIRQELDWTAVDYYHLELDRHAILLAEGLPAESYLDTGNRGFFANSGAPLVLHPDLTSETDYPTREAGSCAPFVWDEASVQPVWQRLFDRVAAIGRPGSQRVTTTDADLRLLADRRTVKAVFSDGDRVIFALPRGAREVRLVSRAQAPTEARPWLGDQRRLGVRVKRIVLRGADELRQVPVDHPGLTRGWWGVECDGPIMSRWTDGEAVLPLPAMSGNVILEIHLAGAMTYVLDAAPEGGTERRTAA